MVEGEISDKKVRFINGYGPQETQKDDIRNEFFNRLDEEVKCAKIAGTAICIELDANSKLGCDIIPGDPDPKSKNGKLLEKVILENDLVVVNGSDICQGTITRFRKTINKTEGKSVYCPTFSGYKNNFLEKSSTQDSIRVLDSVS